MDNILNGIDLEGSFGLIVANAINQLIQMPERKESLENDFPEMDGIDKDLADPKFKARQFTFDCTLEAEDAEGLKKSTMALFSLLRQGGSYEWYNSKIDLSVYVYYIKQIPKEGFYYTHRNTVASTFQLVFGETDPDQNIPTIYLVDHLNRILIP